MITADKIERLYDMVSKDLGSGGRLERLEQSMAGIGRESQDASAMLAKGLSLAGSGNFGTVGWDGSDQTGLLRLSSKTKTIGAQKAGGSGKYLHFGEFLQHVAKAGRGKLGATEMHNVCKAFGSAPCEMPGLITKGFSDGVVNKVPNAEGTGAAGGYLVPPQYYAQLLKFIAEKSFVKASCTTLPMTGATLQFPYLNQFGTTASAATNYPSSNFFGGVYSSWSPEASTATATNPAFRQGVLTARTLLCQTVSSWQLIEDSFIGIDGLITSLLTDSIAWQLDYAFLRGSGVQMPLGVLAAPGTISATRTGGGSTFTLAAASGMLSRAVMSDNFDGLVWVMNQSVLPQLIQMVNNTSSNASLVWINQYAGGASGKLPMSLFGIPIYFTEKVPVLGTAGDVMLLDMTKYLCGDRMQLQIESSPWPYFTSYQQAWRAVWRGDGQPWFDSVVTLADGTTTVSPMIILAA